MPDIRQLPPSVVNKIAAGEVIERPASVVKELLENAVDAHAARIDVSVAQGGLEMVRVSDNGCGIAAEQLPLAVASHATSKIAQADDLFRVQTLGFRGEALASIAEVSRTVLRSRATGAGAGAQIEISGGEVVGSGPCGCPEGTAIEVHNLFFNTPVRRKFLRSTQTEMGHVGEAFTRLALAFPSVHFTLRHNERTLHDLPPAVDWLSRVANFFGEDLASTMIPVDSTDGSVRVSGFVAHPSHSRSHPRMQYLFLNGRAIRDRSLQHALGEAYRGLLLTGQYPIALLRIEMPADQVDVNVHPTKAEVRFAESGRLYSQLLGTLRSKFLSTDLTVRLRLAPTFEAGPDPGAEGSRAMRDDLVAWAKGQLSGLSPASDVADNSFAAAGFAPRHAGEPLPPHAPLTLERIDLRGPAPRHDDPPTTPASFPQHSAPLPQQPSVAAPRFDGRVSALQVHNRYLIAESEDGVVVIDQHALHERILYERLREHVLGAAVESQSLLVPEPVDLSPAESAAALQARPVLETLGISIEPFGGGTVLVASVPAMLASVSPAQVLRDVVELLVSTGKTPDARDVLDSLLHMIACKAAIKAGDRLSPGEIDALLQQRHLAHDAHHCPHGRPTALVFTREELDKQFKRT